MKHQSLLERMEQNRQEKHTRRMRILERLMKRPPVTRGRFRPGSLCYEIEGARRGEMLDDRGVLADDWWACWWATLIRNLGREALKCSPGKRFATDNGYGGQ